RIPVHMVETLNRISRVNRSLVNEMGREPTPEELAQRTGVPARKVRLILESSRKPLSLETPIGDDSELGDFLEDKGAESPNDNLISQDLTNQVERALGTLSPKEKEILRLRFGIGEAGGDTLEGGGGVSRSPASASARSRPRRCASCVTRSAAAPSAPSSRIDPEGGLTPPFRASLRPLVSESAWRTDPAAAGSPLDPPRADAGSSA